MQVAAVILQGEGVQSLPSDFTGGLVHRFQPFSPLVSSFHAHQGHPAPENLEGRQGSHHGIQD